MEDGNINSHRQKCLTAFNISKISFNKSLRSRNTTEWTSEIDTTSCE